MGRWAGCPAAMLMPAFTSVAGEVAGSAHNARLALPPLPEAWCWRHHPCWRLGVGAITQVSTLEETANAGMGVTGGTQGAGRAGGRACRGPGVQEAGRAGGRACRRPGVQGAGRAGGRACRRPGVQRAGRAGGRACRGPGVQEAGRAGGRACRRPGVQEAGRAGGRTWPVRLAGFEPGDRVPDPAAAVRAAPGPGQPALQPQHPGPFRAALPGNAQQFTGGQGRRY